MGVVQTHVQPYFSSRFMNPTHPPPSQNTDADADLARTTAHLLHTSRYIWHFNLMVCVISLWLSSQSPVVYWAVLEVLLTVLILFFLVRIQFDERLLAEIAQGRLTLNHLDNALIQLKLRPTSTVMRSMHARCLVCMRLFYIFCGLTAVHALMPLTPLFI